MAICRCCDSKSGPIRGRFEELYPYEEFKNIISFKDVKKGKFHINLIHYDKNLKNEENIKYYRYFSINTIGGYYPFDNFDMLKTFITKLIQIPFSSSYILMISGNEVEKILEEFHKYDFLIEFIIFNGINKYAYMNNTYNKLKLITNKFSKLTKYFKLQKFSKEDLSMDNHLSMTPLITYYDYKKALFPIHRILANFFKKDNYNFSYSYYLIAEKFINSSFYETEIKVKILRIMKDLANVKGEEEFAKACIRYYTGENLCYVFNKALRNFEKFYVEMGYMFSIFYFYYT